MKEIISNVSRYPNFEIVTPTDELNDLIELYVKGDKADGKVYRSIDINTQIEISGNRKSRFFIQELSDELLKINFWFYGSQYDVEEWNQQGLNEIDKPEFRNFFKFIKEKINPILGTIAYEEDCSELFETVETSPSEFYKLANLQLDKIKERVYRNKNEFEYCWINATEFGEEENIEIEIKTQ